MEPFRILVDKHVYYDPPVEFTANEKHGLWRILEDSVRIDGSRRSVSDAVKIYTRSVFEAVNDADPAQIKCYTDPDDFLL